MSVAVIVFLGVLVIFAGMDLFMLASLAYQGDERNQLIVGKASAWTLLGVMGGNLLEVLENFLKAQPMTTNPFVELEVAAIIYFFALLYYKKRYGG